MNILLINPHYQGNDSGFTFPLGLAYIGAVLLRDGHAVRALDIPGNKLTQGDVEDFLAANPAFDLVGIGSLISNVPVVEALLETVRRYLPAARIVIGGGMASSMPEYIMNELRPDFVVLGEGENIASELCVALENDGDLAAIAGLGFWQDGQPRINQRPADIKDIDQVPFPAWDLFPVENYVHRTLSDWGQVRALPIVTSRSCPFKCVHCAHTSGSIARFRSPENVVAEIETLIDRYSVDSVLVYDELFVANKKRVYEICRLIGEKNLQFQWYCTSRVNLADQKMYEAMKEAGCRLITYGFESGSDLILNNLNKKVTAADNRRAIAITRAASLEPQGTFMLGCPGETLESIEQTTDFIIENDLCVVDFNFCTPYPDAPVFRRLVGEGKIPDINRFVRSLTEATSLIYNLSDLPDQLLIDGRARALERLYAHYIKNLRPAEREENGATVMHCTTCRTRITPDLNADSLLTWYRCQICKKRYFLPLHYFEKARHNFQRLCDELGRLRQEKRTDIVFFGAGTHTIRLLVDLDLEGFTVGIADSNPAKRGWRLLGHEVHHRDDLVTMKGLDAVIVSSYTFSDAICRDIAPLVPEGCEVIRIYGHPEETP